MVTQNPLQSYKRIAAQTASQPQLVLMLYSGAVGFLERAIAAFSEKDPVQFSQQFTYNIQRAQAIIRELNVRLDMERGGEVAINLRLLYDYYFRHLNEALLHKSAKPIQDVLELLRTLRDAWQEMILRGPDAPPPNIPAPPKPRNLEALSTALSP